MADAETQRVTANAELSQGDILQFDSDELANDAPRLGIIINADCDLAHNKTDGVIAYLPLYTFEEYLHRFWAVNYLSDAAAQIVKRALEIAKIEEGFANDLLDWLDTASVDDVTEGLRQYFELKEVTCQQLRAQIVKLAICRAQNISPLQRFFQLCDLERDPRNFARKQVVAAKKALGEGHFFISDLVDHESVGFVIRMRRIYTIDADCCFPSIATQRSRSNGTRSTAYRFASLTPLYRFKLAQLFAQQFSRIGLPDEIMALSELAVESVVSHLKASQ